MMKKDVSIHSSVVIVLSRQKISSSIFSVFSKLFCLVFVHILCLLCLFWVSDLPIYYICIYLYSNTDMVYWGFRGLPLTSHYIWWYIVCTRDSPQKGRPFINHVPGSFRMYFFILIQYIFLKNV